ncbi:MAG: hypothetical protein J6X55_02665 [Victivallales bacterium]|nr:hypothetical protein [Victivallales bacterium]
MCALSNHSGGRVVFGITDKRPRPESSNTL